MSLPKIMYSTGPEVTLAFARGPQGFRAGSVTRKHDNLATSGVRERVVEKTDILIGFTMPMMLVSDDLPTWATFMAWAAGGSTFKFYPNQALATTYFTCELESAEDAETWEPARVGPGVYSADFLFRIVPDAYAPADVGVVLKRFYGIAT